MKKSKLSTQLQGSNLNTGSLLIDTSDGSKDNSSHNTPNFASPRSTNPVPFGDNPFGISDTDFEVIGPKPNKKLQNKTNTSI